MNPHTPTPTHPTHPPHPTHAHAHPHGGSTMSMSPMAQARAAATGSPHGHAAEPAATSLSGRLKAETREQHTAAERHPFHGHLFRGTLPLQVILANHGENGLIQAALEQRLRTSKSPHIVALLRPYHLRASLFAADMAAAGAPMPEQPATTATAAFIDRVNQCDPLTLLGALYVFEGSTNGGQFIQAGIAKHYEGLTLSALSPHGVEQTTRWSAFRNAMDGLPLTPAQADAVVTGAAATFTAISAIMDEIMAQHGQPVTRPGVPA